MAESLGIVHACPHFRPHLGGVESHVESVARGLAARGHAVTVLTASEPDAPARERFDGVEVERLPRLGSPLATPVLAGLKERVAALRPDVVHSHSPPPLTSFQASRAAHRAGVPHVLTHHCDLQGEAWWGPAAARLYEGTFHRAALAASARIVVTTRAYADTSRALWRVPPERLAVVPNPVDVVFFRPGLPQGKAREELGLPAEQGIALFVGRLAPHKGLDQFVEAALHTRGALHVLAGEGPERPRLEGLARRLGLAERVRFLGRVPREALPGLYAACDLAVLPSASRLEAFGIAALEAMACARPVVVSDIPGVREVVEPGATGLLAQPLDAQDLARKVRELLDAPERRAAMGARARERVEERFATPRVVAQLEALYRSLARR